MKYLKPLGTLFVAVMSIWALVLLIPENDFNVIIAILMIIVLVGVLIYEFFISKPLELDISTLIKVGALMFSGLIVYYISDVTNPILAAALVGLIGGFLLEPYKAPIYVGAFIGMTSAFSIEIFLITLPLGGILYVLLENDFEGVGGKYGMIAFVGVFLVALIFSNSKIPVSFEIDINVVFLGVAILASMATYFLNKYLNNTVLSSSFIGLIFGVIVLFVDDIMIYHVCLVGFGATFIGMQTRFKYYYMVISALLFVILYQFAYLYSGIGGTLGFLAFLSLLPLALVDHILKKGAPYKLFKEKQKIE